MTIPSDVPHPTIALTDPHGNDLDITPMWCYRAEGWVPRFSFSTAEPGEVYRKEKTHALAMYLEQFMDWRMDASINYVTQLGRMARRYAHAQHPERRFGP